MAISGFPEIKTDQGHRVIIYSTNAGGDQPIHGAWFCDLTNSWLVTAWSEDGLRIPLRGRSALDITGAINEKKILVEETQTNTQKE